MKINVRLFAAHREAAGRGRVTVEVDDGATAGDVLRILAGKYPALKALADSTVLMVNRRMADAKRVLHGGDEVALFPPVSGG